MTALDLEPNVDAISNITRTFLAVHRKDRSGGGRPLELISTLGGAASVAEDESCTAIFAGGFFDRDELVRRFAGGQSSLEDAELLLRIYRACGEDVVAQIRGFFAVVIWDERRSVLLFARDQLGHHSLFFGHASDGLYLSDSIGTLAAEPEVSTEIDRTAVADILMHRQRNPDETCFADVSRARAGWLYRVDAGGISASRYWFPSDPDRNVEWITKDEVGRFDELMERAVARSLAFGPSSIFLSGGLDSVSVAAVAADHAKAAGLPAPLALSLAFPDPQYDETAIQTLVAERLGLPQTLIPFTQAEGSDRLLMTGLRAARVWPTPLVNVWQPLYTYLALAGREQGACTMMTGAGGDEWLSTSPSWAAYGLRRLDIGLVYHLWRTYLTSYDVKPLPMLKNLVWRYGLKEMSRKVAVKAVSRAAPRRTSAVKRRRFLEAKPDWLAPEPGARPHARGTGGIARPTGRPARAIHRRGFAALRAPAPGNGAGGGLRTGPSARNGDVHAVLGRRSRGVSLPRSAAASKRGPPLEEPGQKDACAAISGSRLRPAEENSGGRPLDPPSLRRGAGCLARARRADKPRGSWNCRKCWARIKGERDTRPGGRRTHS